MNREEKISLYGYIEDLYQAMQIGSITFEPKHSSELYDLISRVLKENQELKEKLNCDLKWAFKYDELYQENKKLKEQLQQENKELKNLNRIYEEIISDDKENYKLFSSEIKRLENQQKEFIKWLENKLVSELDAFTELKVCDVLSKYKEIIGGKE